ncbi:MAG: hypothetical protein ACN4G0_07245, partial [Polyangiales bacterium]
MPTGVPFRFAIVVVAAASLFSSRAAAQCGTSRHVALDSRGELLGAWLDAQASQQKKERRFTGGSSLAVGATG